MFATELVKKNNFDQTFMSPEVKIDQIFHKNKRFFAVRDDLLPGGSKQRACAPFLQKLVKEGQDDFYYASPFAGFAQVALAYTCQQLGLNCRLFCESDPTQKLAGQKHEFTKLAEAYGANISMHATLKEAEERATEMACQSRRSYKIPLGFKCDPFTDAFEEALRIQWAKVIDQIGFVPRRLWLPVGSGTLVSVFERIVDPTTQLMCVDVHVLPAKDARILSLVGHSKINLFSAPEYFKDRADLPPEIPSNVHYDAKLWQFLVKYGQADDLWWNVAR